MSSSTATTILATPGWNDAAAISAVVGLSVQSVGRKAAPVDFPDFTRGRWQTAPPVPIIHM